MDKTCERNVLAGTTAAETVAPEHDELRFVAVPHLRGALFPVRGGSLCNQLLRLQKEGRCHLQESCVVTQRLAEPALQCYVVEARRCLQDNLQRATESSATKRWPAGRISLDSFEEMNIPPAAGT